MIIRRATDELGKPAVQIKNGEHWLNFSELAPADREEVSWINDLQGQMQKENTGDKLLPVSPRSFRDCSLFEKHWIQSSRGYAKRFLPTGYAISKIYESVLRKPFPPFKPARLAYQQPAYYFGNHMTFQASGTPIKKPAFTDALDYELELGWFIKKPLFNASPEEALDAIGGLVVVNDWSARDIQREEMQTGLGPQKCKHFASAMSKTLATADEILPHIGSLTARVTINGEEVVSTSTGNMLHNIADTTSYLSKEEHLFPGELIATGTLPNGAGMENGYWIKPGDTLHLEIEGIGEIVQEVFA